jgi:hypothetical protein
MGECDVGRVNSGLSFFLFSSLLGLFCVCVFPLACVCSFSIMAFYWVNLLPPKHPILVLTFPYVYFQCGVGYLIFGDNLQFRVLGITFFFQELPGWVGQCPRLSQLCVGQVYQIWFAEGFLGAISKTCPLCWLFPTLISSFLYPPKKRRKTEASFAHVDGLISLDA